MVQCDKNWELENGKVHFNTIRLTNTAGHVAPVLYRGAGVFVYRGSYMIGHFI